MNWLVVVGFVALLALVLSGTLFVFMAKRRKVRPLPDGDYSVTIVETHDTLQGVVTVFRIDEPEELKGQKVTIKEGKTNG